MECLICKVEMEKGDISFSSGCGGLNWAGKKKFLGLFSRSLTPIKGWRCEKCGRVELGTEVKK